MCIFLFSNAIDVAMYWYMPSIVKRISFLITKILVECHEDFVNKIFGCMSFPMKYIQFLIRFLCIHAWIIQSLTINCQGIKFSFGTIMCAWLTSEIACLSIYLWNPGWTFTLQHASEIDKKQKKKKNTKTKQNKDKTKNKNISQIRKSMEYDNTKYLE